MLALDFAALAFGYGIAAIVMALIVVEMRAVTLAEPESPAGS